MGGRQLLKLGAPAAAAALMAATGWPVPAAQAAAGIVGVPCRAPALAAALNNATSGETLSLAAGCDYRLGRALPAIGRDLTIQGHRATLEPAPGAPAFTLLSLAGGTVRLHDLNFTGGRGAIAVTGTANLAVSGGRFTGNHATGGGAIDCEAAVGDLTVTGAWFAHNSSTFAGGAINVGVATNHTTLTGDTFIDNNSVDGDTLTGVTIRGNDATEEGGGILTYETGLQVSGSRIIGDHTAGYGGGLWLYASDKAVLRTTQVRGNTAEDGGGIYDMTASVLAIAHSTIRCNHATADGGGIDNAGHGAGAGSAGLTDSTLSQNQAGGAGGGLLNAGTADLGGSKVEHNQAGQGGGIFNAAGPGAVTLQATQVTGNRLDNCEPLETIAGCTG